MDGEQHGDPDRSEHDRRRTAWLETRNIAVLRLDAEAVRVNLDAILTWIKTIAEERMGG